MNHLSSNRCVPTGALLIVLGALAGAQTTWYVDVAGTPPGTGTAADPYTSIQYAIAQPTTINGHTLLVAPGEYVENVTTQGKSLTLRASGGPLVTTIRPTQAGSVVLLIGADTHFEGFTVTGQIPAGAFTAAVYVKSGEGRIRHCIVRDNTNGHGILSAYDAWVYNCTVTGNAVGIRSAQFGGFLYAESSIIGFNGTNVAEDPGSAGVATSFCLIGVADPGFWNYDARDLHLRPGSPAIDGGNPMALPDPDGSVVDAGALTYDPSYAPAPSTYCTGKLNSQGCTPAIGATGSASATPSNPFTITAVDEVPQKTGLLFFGFGERAQPFQGGFHCVELPTKRVGVQDSGGSGGCTGAYAFDMGGYIQSGVHPGLVAGALVYCQWWSRDPLDPAGFGTGLSNALTFGIAP